jgi:hypothetical protein
MTRSTSVLLSVIPRRAIWWSHNGGNRHRGEDEEFPAPPISFSLWQIHHFDVTKMRIPPCWMTAYKWLGPLKDPSHFLFAFWLSIMAGGPLRARPRPALRFGHKARHISVRLAALARENAAPGPCASRP